MTSKNKLIETETRLCPSIGYRLVLFEIIRNRLRRKVVVSQFLTIHESYQASILAQKWLEQVPAGLEDPWSIHKQHLTQALGVVCKEDISLQQKAQMESMWLNCLACQLMKLQASMGPEHKSRSTTRAAITFLMRYAESLQH